MTRPKYLSIHHISATHLIAYLGIFCLLILIESCTDRGHNNPFDTQGSTQSPVSLSVISEDNNFVTLEWSWRIDPLADYSGFRVYRSVDNTHNFSLYKEIPRHQFSFVDSSVQRYRWYYYKLSVYGPSVESALTQTQKIYLGQGLYWILSSNGFWVRKVSYDLSRTLRNYYTNYPAEEWAVSLRDSTIGLCFIRYARGFSQLNLREGTEDFFYYGDLNSPLDVEYDPSQRRMYVLDAKPQGTDDQLYVFKNKILERKIALPPGNYFKLYLSSIEQSLIVLGETKYLKLALNSSTVTDSLSFATGFVGQDMDVSADSIFILTSSDQLGMSRIYKISFDNSEDSLTVAGLFYRITFDYFEDEFYLAEYIPSARDLEVKLSSQGTRLFQLSDFEYVEQIGLNPYDQSFIVVDRLDDQLFLYDRNGNEISRSRSNSFYDPIRIFIE